MSYSLRKIEQQRKAGGTKDWKTFVLPWGKYRGDTMYIVYVNDYRYIRDFLADCDDDIVREAAQAAVTHKNETDPWTA